VTDLNYWKFGGNTADISTNLYWKFAISSKKIFASVLLAVLVIQLERIVPGESRSIGIGDRWGL
jgi:hypothetical protein